MSSYAGYSIKKSIETLLNYKKSIGEKTELERIKVRLSTELEYMLKAAEELISILAFKYGEVEISTISLLRAKVLYGLSEINNLKDNEQAKELIELYRTFLDENFEHIPNSEFISSASRLTVNRFDQCEELTPRDCTTIMNAINMNREFNVFSTRARCGDTMSNIKDLSSNKAHTYALEADEELLPVLKTKCDRTIKGVLTGSRISNDVFDIMYLVPKISWEYSFTELGGLSEKIEKTMLRNHIKHLRTNGIFIYCIPYFRLTKDIVFLASKLLDNVEVIRRHDSPLKQIIIIGTKKITKEPKEDVYKYLNDLKYENIDYVLNKKYNLAAGGIKQPEFFRGSALDQDEIQNLINNSGLMESFFKKQEVDNNKQSARPLMPFNMGQIGLVLTSGCLDGTVEEYEGQYHTIKGMVTKIRHNTTSNDTSNEEVNIETISNKVQINIVTPDGQFIELA